MLADQYMGPIYLASRTGTKPLRLARYIGPLLEVGVNDRITRAMKQLDPAPVWNWEAVDQRQRWFADIALDVWDVRAAIAVTQPIDHSQ
jgi:hypothetical protein